MECAQEICEWRAAQRAELLARRKAIAQSDRDRWSGRITQLLSEGFAITYGKIVGLYWPFQGEFDPRFAIRQFRRSGAVAALPAVLQKGAPLQFREWWPGVPCSKGVFNLPVPEGTAVVRPNVLLIPPVGFDLQGFRLGYGGGYYDRTLAVMAPQPLKIGVAFELSRIATIRPQPYDIPMDFIVTEAAIHHVSQGRLVRVTDPSEARKLSGQLVRNRELRSMKAKKTPH
jgi:5,10-methenyltetrahydrofolate synthetase